MFSSLLHRFSVSTGSSASLCVTGGGILPIPKSSCIAASSLRQPIRLFHNARSPLKAEYLRSYFKYFLPIQTRWNDNDQYGHVNNAVYYVYMDTIINHFHITRGSFEPTASPHVGLCVSSSCTFLGTPTNELTLLHRLLAHPLIILYIDPLAQSPHISACMISLELDCRTQLLLLLFRSSVVGSPVDLSRRGRCGLVRAQDRPQ